MASPVGLSSARARRAFATALLRWYDRARRPLPWRATRDPYAIWVSEIMLQQTRVAAVLEHYRRFLQRFPTVDVLARARCSAVLAEWSGLGYYRRARMLHAAARVVVGERNGALPTTAEQWRTLPGVGRYTAAAIASIAFGEAAAVVDGNVERVLERLSGRRLRANESWRTAQDLLSSSRPGDFNQAMMELGATVCLPAEPECGRCPVFARCATRGALGRAAQMPRRKGWLVYRLTLRQGRVLLVRRPHTESLMAGMWELPSGRVSRLTAPSNALRLRHSITTTDYDVLVIPGPGRANGRSRWVPLASVTRLPLTGLTRKALRRAGLLANRIQET